MTNTNSLCDHEKNLSDALEALEKLSEAQILKIDELLRSIGDFGEIHLIVTHGQLRYINKVESYKFLQNNIDNRL